MLHRNISVGDHSFGCRLQASLLQLGWTAAPLWALLSAHGVLARLCDIRRRNRFLRKQAGRRTDERDAVVSPSTKHSSGGAGGSSSSSNTPTDGASDAPGPAPLPPAPLDCPDGSCLRPVLLAFESLCSTGMDPSFPLVEDDYGAGESELTMDFCAFNARTRIVAYHCIAWGVAVVYACVVGFGYAGPDSTGTFLWCWVPHSSPGARTAMFMAPQSVVMGLLVAVAIGLGCGFTREERASIDFGRRLVPWATFVFAMVQLLWIVTSVLGEEGVGGMDDDQGLGPGSGGGGYDEPSGVSRFMNDFKACLTAGEGLLVAVAVAAAVFVADQRAAVKAWLPLLADLAEGGTEDWEDESDLEEGDEDDEDEEEGDEFGEGEGEGVARGDSLDEEGMRVGGARAAVRGEEKDGGMQEGVPGVDGGPHGLID